jgi:hypothetical protein
MASHRLNNIERRFGPPDISVSTDPYDAPCCVDASDGNKFKVSINGTLYNVPMASAAANDLPGVVIAKTALFTEDATSLTHTATFPLPAGATLLDIIVTPQVLWTGGTAAFTCGDAAAATGWFTAVNLKATDLLLGERLQASGGTHGWGGKNGTYLVDASGVFGGVVAPNISGYYTTASSVIGVVTVTTPATTVGRTRMTVLYSLGSAVTPVLA